MFHVTISYIFVILFDCFQELNFHACHPVVNNYSNAKTALSKMADERNFRLLYYEQLGLRNVDQVKALEHLLRDEKLDIEKLSTFALKFALPSLYRSFVWKVLLGVLPYFQTSHKLAERARTDQYKDLEEALIVMRMIPKKSEDQKIEERILWMYLLEEGMISMPSQKTLQRDEKKIEIFRAIAIVCCDIMENEIDAYWVTKRYCPVIYCSHSCMTQALSVRSKRSIYYGVIVYHNDRNVLPC